MLECRPGPSGLLVAVPANSKHVLMFPECHGNQCPANATNLQRWLKRVSPRMLQKEYRIRTRDQQKV